MGDDSTRTALIAAASELHRAQAGRVLSPHVAQVVQVATVEAAVAELRADGARFDAVLIDLGMRRIWQLTCLTPLDNVVQAQPAAVVAAFGGRHEVAGEATCSAHVLWAPCPHEAAMRIARWWHIPGSVPAVHARIAEALGSKIGTTLEQTPVLALTVAGRSASAIAAELRITERAVKDRRKRAALRAGQTSLGPIAQRAQMLAVGEPVKLLPADWRCARKCLKREKGRERKGERGGRARRRGTSDD